MRILTPPCQGPCQGSTVFKLLRCQWLPLQQMCQQLSLPSWVTLSSIFLLKKQSQNNLILPLMTQNHHDQRLSAPSFFQNLVRYASFPIHQPKPPAFQKMNLDFDKFRFTKWLNPSLHNLKCFHLSFATCLYTGLCLAQLTDASDNSYWNLQWFCDYLHGSW